MRPLELTDLQSVRRFVDDVNYRLRPYDPLLAYGPLKTAVIMFGVAASTRWADDGITVNTLNPGAIATSLQRRGGGRLATPVELQKTPAQGASTPLLLATSPQPDGVGFVPIVRVGRLGEPATRTELGRGLRHTLRSLRTRKQIAGSS